MVDVSGTEVVTPHALHVEFLTSSMSGALCYFSLLNNTLFDHSIHVGDCVLVVIHDGSLAKMNDHKCRGR